MKGKQLFYVAALPVLSMLAAPANAISRFETYPERSSVDIYPNAENLNRIIITGVYPDDVRIQVRSGDGTFKLIGNQWYWSHIPDALSVGTTRIVRYVAYYGGVTQRLDSAEADFIYTVKELLYLDTPYGPTSDDGKYIYGGMPFDVRVKGIGLNGEYRIVMKVNRETVRIVNEPYLQIIPSYINDTGKTVSFSVYYRPIKDCDYQMIDYRSFTIKPIPLIVIFPFMVQTSSYIVFAALEGIGGQRYIPSTDNLIIESDGFLADTAYRLFENEVGVVSTPFGLPYLYKSYQSGKAKGTMTDHYIVKVTNKVRTMPGKKAAVIVKIINPLTSESSYNYVYLKR